MRVLDTPLFDLITELYARPLSSEPWTPPGWRPKGKCGNVIGTLTPAAWRLVGLMRDVDETLRKRYEASAENVALKQELQLLGLLSSEVLVLMIESQVRLDLIASGVKPEDAEFFCIREGGDILDCACKRAMAQFGDVLGDALSAQLGGSRTQFV